MEEDGQLLRELTKAMEKPQGNEIKWKLREVQINNYRIKVNISLVAMLIIVFTYFQELVAVAL